MNRIHKLFSRLAAGQGKALILYLMAGDPDPESSLEIALTLLGAGADLLEIGLPFSDPLADGPVIQAAAQRALAAGTRVEKVLALMGRLREMTAAPQVLLSYYNPILHYGEKRFLEAAAQAGVDGLIIPDLPLEESEVATGGPGMRSLARANGLELIPLVAPTTPDGRLAEVGKREPAFTYAVSLTGVTGARVELSPDLETFLKRLRRHSRVPVAVGFGLSRPEQVSRVRDLVDGVIIGSRIVQEIEGIPQQGLETVKEKLAILVRGFRRALDRS
ncbi:MAG: tryptophan synthase subunit alpha [Firmicutes bacterium]|nr:tryptophan synthase subunit alpha [Bacillota bacterium]